MAARNSVPCLRCVIADMRGELAADQGSVGVSAGAKRQSLSASLGPLHVVCLYGEPYARWIGVFARLLSGYRQRIKTICPGHGRGPGVEACCDYSTALAEVVP